MKLSQLIEEKDKISEFGSGLNTHSLLHSLSFLLDAEISFQRPSPPLRVARAIYRVTKTYIVGKRLDFPNHRLAPRRSLRGTRSGFYIHAHIHVCARVYVYKRITFRVFLHTYESTRWFSIRQRFLTDVLRNISIPLSTNYLIVSMTNFKEKVL